MTLEELLKRNEAFCKSCCTEKQQELAKGQHPHTLVLTCSDSRVIPEEIFQSSFGELFVIRTAGNILNVGEKASIEYGIKHLNIKLILVLGHTHCGAVHSALKNEHDIYLDSVLDQIRTHLGKVKDERDACIKNTLSVANEIQEIYKEDNLEIVPLLYELETSHVIKIEEKL